MDDGNTRDDDIDITVVVAVPLMVAVVGVDEQGDSELSVCVWLQLKLGALRKGERQLERERGDGEKKNNCEGCRERVGV